MQVKKAATFLGAIRSGPIARGSEYSLVIKATAIGLGFLQAVMVARILGAEGYGTVAVALSIANLGATFSVLGLGGYAVREVARLRACRDWPALRGFILWAALVAGAISIVLGAIIGSVAYSGSFFLPTYSDEIVFGGVLVFLVALLILFKGVAQGLNHVAIAQIPIDIARPTILIVVLATAALGVFRLTTTGLMAVYATICAVVLFAGVLFLRKSSEFLGKSKPNTYRSAQWCRDTLPFFGITMLGIVGTEANTVLLGSLAGPKEAGLYQPVARLAPILIIVVEALAMPLAPRITELWESRDYAKLKQVLGLSTVAATVGTLLVAGFVILLAPLIFGAFGKEFLASQSLLIWIAGAQIINASAGASALLLAMTGHMAQRIFAQLVTMVVQVGLALLLVGPYGAAGAVASLAGAVVVWSVSHWLIARHVTGIDTSLIGAIRHLKR